LSLVRRVLSNLRTDDPITPLLDEYLLTCQPRISYHIPLEERLRPPGRLSASGVGGCRRRAAYAFLGVSGKKIEDPVTMRVLRRGTWIHHEWQATLLDMQKVMGPDRIRVLGIEKRVVIPRLFVIGHYDAKVSIERADPVMIDFKSARDESYRWKSSKGPDPQHVDQITVYQQAERCKKGYIVYDNKNDQEHHVSPVDYLRDVWDRTKTWCERTIDDLRAHRVPPMHPECERGSYMAKNCPYSMYCYGDLDIRQLMYGGKRSKFETPEQWWDHGLRLERRHKARASQNGHADS